MKNINIFLLIAFLLSSCAPAATTASTNAPQAILPTSTLTPEPTTTQTPNPTTTPVPTQIGGGSGKLIFEYYKVAYEKEFPDLKGEVNIFTSNIDGSDLTPITNGIDGINRIVDISPDSKAILVASRSTYLGKSALYLIDLNSTNNAPLKLANGLDGEAIFLDNARIVYIGQGSKGFGIYTMNTDGTNQTRIGIPTGQPARLVGLDKNRVYWRTSQKVNFKDASGVLYMYGDYGGLWWTNLDGSGQGKLESDGEHIITDKFAFSPDGKRVAWITTGLEPGCSLLGGLAIWAPFVRNGSMTRNAQKTDMFFHENSPHFGKTIDITYIENYVSQCFVMHIAPLSDMDNNTRIPLIPPYDPNKDDFYYHNEYKLTWSPDNSQILAYDDGDVTRYLSGFIDHYPLALYEIDVNNPNPNLALLKVVFNKQLSKPGSNTNPIRSESFTSFRFSPDAKLLLFIQWNKFTNFYASDVHTLNLETLNLSDDFSTRLIPDAETKRVGEVYWLP